MRVSGFELKYIVSLFITDTTVPLTIQGSTLVSVLPERCIWTSMWTERLLEKIAWTKMEDRVGNMSLVDGGPCNGL